MAVVKVTQQISRAKDAREDTKLLMQPYANWEEFLIPAPISINILGQLVFISSKDDFSINKNPPPTGFKFISYPDSFRACLMQVANAGWNAFNEAHKNMDQIRLHSANVGVYVKAAVKILMKEDEQLIELLLPNQLKNIHEISKRCTVLADATEKKFEYVINIIQELMEQSINAKAAHSNELEATKRAIEASKLRKKAAEESNRRANESWEQLKSEMATAQDNYNKAMNSLPSGWEVIGLNFVEALSNSLTSLMDSYAKQAAMAIFPEGKIVGLVGGLLDRNLGGLTGSNPGNSKSDPVDSSHVYSKLDPVASNYAYSKSAQILPLVECMNDFIEKGQIKWDDLYDRKQENSKIACLEQQFKQVEDSVKKHNACKPAMQCLHICNQAIDICQRLASVGPGNKGDDKLTTELIKDLEDLKQIGRSFDTQSKAFTASSAFSVTAPEMAKSQQGSSGPAGQIAIDNARFRIEQAKAQLSRVQDMVQKTTDSMDKTKQELTEVIIQLNNCHVKEIDFMTTIRMLTMGLEAMGKVKEQWGKMVRFFQMIANLISTSMSRSLNDFLQTAQRPIAKLKSYSSKQFMKDLLYKQAFQSSNIASLITMIAETYTEVSNRFLMDGISGLGKLMALDPEGPDFAVERAKFQEGCKEAGDGITLLVQQNKRDFETKAAERIAKIERELQAVMPPSSEDEIKQIKDTVHGGMIELTADEVNQYI